MNYTSIIIPFLGGLGMFIYGMQIMAQGLENAAGNKMKSLLEASTQNKLLGVLLGAFITAVIQSSSATTVMVVGFECRNYEPDTGNGCYHGCEYRDNGNRMACFQRGMGKIFEPDNTGADCDYDWCCDYVDRKKKIHKGYCEYYRRIWSFVCRYFYNVRSS